MDWPKLVRAAEKAAVEVVSTIILVGLVFIGLGMMLAGYEWTVTSVLFILLVTGYYFNDKEKGKEGDG